MSFVSRGPTTGTGTGTAIIIGDAPAALAATPNVPAKGPDAPSAAAVKSSATTIATNGETMLLGESHEWQDNDGGVATRGCVHGVYHRGWVR